MSNYVKVYLKTFDENGDYGDFFEITKDVELNSIGNIKQAISNNKYDVGSFKFNNLNLVLRNDHGKYSEPGVLQSNFVFRREQSIVKISWQQQDNDNPICGIAICGEAILLAEVDIYYGFINDSASTQNVRDNRIKFSVQGLESILSRVETNFGDLPAAGGSDTFSDYIFEILDQAKITDVLTVDAGNINCDVDLVPDDISELEATTVKEAMDLLLEASNSVLYVDVFDSDLPIIVKPREESATLKKTFYGQASNNGAENIIDINNVTNGINRTFNFWKWADVTTVASDAQSITDNGVLKSEIDNSLVTGSTKRTTILEAYRDEFKDKKREFNLKSILDFTTAELNILDKVNVDYPVLYFPATATSIIPIFGVATYGSDRYPVGSYTLNIPSTENYKIIGKTINLKNGTVEYELREV